MIEIFFPKISWKFSKISAGFLQRYYHTFLRDSFRDSSSIVFASFCTLFGKISEKNNTDEISQTISARIPEGIPEAISDGTDWAIDPFLKFLRINSHGIRGETLERIWDKNQKFKYISRKKNILYGNTFKEVLQKLLKFWKSLLRHYWRNPRRTFRIPEIPHGVFD